MEGRDKEKVVRSVKKVELTFLNNAERENVNAESDNIGLSISDPKRRRIEENIRFGPQDDQCPATKKCWIIRIIRTRIKKLIIGGPCNGVPPNIMSFLSWNFQGLGHPWNVRFLADLVR